MMGMEICKGEEGNKVMNQRMREASTKADGVYCLGFSESQGAPLQLITYLIVSARQPNLEKKVFVAIITFGNKK